MTEVQPSMAGPAQRFLQYLSDNPAAAPQQAFAARGMSGEHLPTLFASIPRGVVMLFDHWLVFLTESRTGAGGGNLWGEFWGQFKAEIKHAATGGLNEAIGHVGKWMGLKKEEEASLEKYLANPNSLFIPLDQVVSVEAHSKFLQGGYVRVRTTEGMFLICQWSQAEGLAGVRGAWGGQWRPEFVEALQQTVGGQGHTTAPPAPQVTGEPVSVRQPRKRIGRPFQFGDWSSWSLAQKRLLTVGMVIFGLMCLFWFPWSCTAALVPIPQDGQSVVEAYRALNASELVGEEEIVNSSVFTAPDIPPDPPEVTQRGLCLLWKMERATGWFLLRVGILMACVGGIIWVAREERGRAH
jgi:hypothetical protein